MSQNTVLDETESELMTGAIIGQSRCIKTILQQVEQVAPTDAPVLLLGETGTGKELVAREIHHRSSRNQRPLVVVNCAALPAALMESELFGHEKGAFTGAVNSQMGRFEVADGSTIFLDEIGELSLDMQVKLLRVLQEGELQRLGNSKTYHVDVRVIAATNRDLVKETQCRRFREDLFYRLNVFPIQIPPLRERMEDVPELTHAFVKEFATRMKKEVSKVSSQTIDALQRHSWAGNIRELRNVIERGVILSSGDTLCLPAMNEAPNGPPSGSLADIERQYILRTLEKTGWRIKGRYGAARLLDLKPSTLYSRMKKLGIPLAHQRDDMPTPSAQQFSS
jgi:formate hydrogenlyase transcriptional activator